MTVTYQPPNQQPPTTHPRDTSHIKGHTEHPRDTAHSGNVTPAPEPTAPSSPPPH